MIPVTILQLLKNFKYVNILEPERRRRTGLYADIPVPVLQVPSGEEGGPGGLHNFLKEEENEEDEEEKKEDDDKEEDMKGEEEGLGGYTGQPGGGGGQDGEIPLGLFCHLFPSPAAHASGFFPR